MLNSKYKERWAFLAKEQVGGREILAKQTWQASCESRPGQDITYGIVEDEDPHQMGRMGILSKLT